MVEGPVILFDGVCNLCCGSVRFVLKRDRARRFRFASLQSEAGKRLAPGRGLESVILIDEAGVHTRSTAALRTLKSLSFPWPLFYYGLIWLPGPFRDRIYDLVGKRRYDWFGRKDACWIPQGAVKERFLDL